MLSVLIIDNKIYDHYCKYDYFFGHFEHNADVAVCVWNRQSIEDDVSSMLPQLMDTVRNVPEWDAYIICEPHDPLPLLRDDFKNLTQYAINPYERANHADYDPEQDRLLKLVYYLGGRGDDRVDYIEQYQFRAARPSHIYLITPRMLKNNEQQKLFLLSDLREHSIGVLESPARVLAGETDIMHTYSEFWARYEYPPSCRFLVYDFPEENHQTYGDAWFAFWISVITMTQNRFTNATVAPFKLHLLSVDINDEQFAAYINRFYTMLQENIELNNYAILREEQLEREEAANTDITIGGGQEPIYVTFPHFDVAELFASSENIGWTKDVPVLDEADWHEQMDLARDSISALFKAINRGKGEAVDAMHENFEHELPGLMGKRLTKYDAEEIKEALETDELKMIQLNTANASNRTLFEKAQAAASKVVSTFMKRRLRLKIAIGLLATCMLVYFVGFVPYLVNSVTHSIPSFLVALPISAAAIVVPGLAGCIALYVLFRKMKKLISLYNEVIVSHYEEVEQSALLQGEYLTLMLDYMKKHQILVNAKSSTSHKKQIEELMIANAVFDDAIAACATLATLRSITLTRITDQFLQNTIDQLPHSRIFLYEDNPDGTMTFNAVEDALSAPFSFTEELHIVPEELYECDYYTQDKEESE